MYLSKSIGSTLPGRGLINPAFVIKIVPATDNLQQKPSTGRENPTNDYLDNLKIGTNVKGFTGKRFVKGRVSRIIKDQQGDGIYVIVSDIRGKEHKIEGSQIKILKGAEIPSDSDSLISSPGLFNESKLLFFSEFECR